MTNIKIGDASIRVTLDPQAAKQDLDRLRRELEKIDAAKKKAQEEMEKAQRGEAPSTAPRQDPNNPGGARTVPGTNVPAGTGTFGVPQSGITSSGSVQEKKVSGGKSLVNTVKAALSDAMLAMKTTAAAARGGAVISEVAKTAFAGTPLEGLTQFVDAQVQQLSEKITKLEAAISNGLPDTVTDVVDYNIAALKLGGKFPDDQDQLFKQFAEINYNQSQLGKNFAVETERQVASVATRALMEALKGTFGQ